VPVLPAEAVAKWDLLPWKASPYHGADPEQTIILTKLFQIFIR